MRQQNHSTSCCANIRNSGHYAFNAGGIGNFSIGNRHVNIDACYYSGTFQRHIIQCFPSHVLPCVLSPEGEPIDQQQQLPPPQDQVFRVVQINVSANSKDQNDSQEESNSVVHIICGLRFGRPRLSCVYGSLPIATAVSAMRQEKPHSLSYQLSMRTRLPPITVVCKEAKLAECVLWL